MSTQQFIELMDQVSSMSRNLNLNDGNGLDTNVAGDGLVASKDGTVTISSTAFVHLGDTLAKLKVEQAAAETARAAQATFNGVAGAASAATPGSLDDQVALAIAAATAAHVPAPVVVSSAPDLTHISHMISCPSCGHSFPRPPPPVTFYVVTKGKQIGVFDDWSVVSPLVIGVKRAAFHKADTRVQAQTSFMAAVNANTVEVLV
ncbi:hypothetical protein C8J56DRAFT_897697 [Mycena floridula]|nr:hypothetical protein C8J56DRAFT_897697 [Mycena floridula]